MNNLLHKEYIYNGFLDDADSKYDKGHEDHIIQGICDNHADNLVQIAEDLLETKFYDDDNMGMDETETKEELESYIKKINYHINYGEGFDPDDVYNFYDFIKKIDPNLVSNPKLQDAMEAINGDARLYGCKNLGYIIIRGNNFEVWQFNQKTAKEIVSAVYAIFDMEHIINRKNMLNQEINVYSYNNKKSRTYTLEELEKGEILKTATAPTTKASMYIPQPSRTQDWQQRYTSESFSFKQWLAESSITDKSKSVQSKWVKPNLKKEREEMERQAEDLNLDAETVQKAFERAKLTILDDTTWNKMKNTDSNDPKISMSKIKTWKEKDVNNITKGIKEGEALPAPMVLIHDEIPYCVAGNTRLSISKVLGVRPKVLLATIF
jgi:hypothetical protein